MALQVGRAQDEHCSAHLAMQMEREGKGKPCSSTGEGEARELDGGGGTDWEGVGRHRCVSEWNQEAHR